MTSTPDTRRNKIVLIVDDMPDNLNFIRTVLDAAGYLTVSAAGGPECIGVALRMTPRVILLDIEMPMINGFETCRLLRKHEILRQVPIMFLTANKTREAMRDGIVAGGNDFMVKPFKPQKLIERIDHWAEQPLAVSSQ